MQAYVDAFHNVRVGIRKPYAVAAENNWGLYNDIFGVTSDGGTPTFLEWANSGNTDMPGSTEEDIAASAMPEWWKLNYSGGEFANGDFRTNALNENIATVLDQIRDSHTTWLGPCSACDYKTDNPEYEEMRYNIETMFSTMGYNYGVYSITQPDQLITGAENPLSITWINYGVAPIYYNCDISLQLRDVLGNVCYEEKQEGLDMTTWLPGRTTTDMKLNIPADLTAEDYTVCVKINTSDSRHDIVWLANRERWDDGSYELCTVPAGPAKAEEPESTPEPTPVETKEDTGKSETSANTEATSAPTQAPADEKTAEKSKTNPIIWIVGGVGAAALITAAIFLLKKRGAK